MAAISSHAVNRVKTSWWISCVIVMCVYVIVLAKKPWQERLILSPCLQSNGNCSLYIWLQWKWLTGVTYCNADELWTTLVQQVYLNVLIASLHHSIDEKGQNCCVLIVHLYRNCAMSQTHLWNKKWKRVLSLELYANALKIGEFYLYCL